MGVWGCSDSTVSGPSPVWAYLHPGLGAASRCEASETQTGFLWEQSHDFHEYPQIQATSDHPGSTQVKFGKETARMLCYPYELLGYMAPTGDTSGQGSSSPAACEPRPRTSTHCHPAISSGEPAPKLPPAPKIPVPPCLAKAEPGFEGRRWAAPSQSPLMGTRWPEPSGSPTPGTGRGPQPQGCSAGTPGAPWPVGDAEEPSTLLLLLLPLPSSRRSVLQ